MRRRIDEKVYEWEKENLIKRRFVVVHKILQELSASIRCYQNVPVHPFYAFHRKTIPKETSANFERSSELLNQHLLWRRCDGVKIPLQRSKRS